MKRAIVVLIALSLAACTSLQPFPIGTSGAAAPPAHLALKAGQGVRIVAKDQRVITGTVTGVSPSSLALTDDGRQMQIDAKDIMTLERREIDVLKTTLLTVIVLYAAAAALLSKAAFFPPPP